MSGTKYRWTYNARNYKALSECHRVKKEDLPAYYQFAAVEMHKREEYGALLQLLWEEDWLKGRRPYYRVFPTVLPMLSRLDLSDIPVEMLQAPSGYRSMLIELPDGNNLLPGLGPVALMWSIGLASHKSGSPAIGFGVNFLENEHQGWRFNGLSWDVWHMSMGHELTLGGQLQAITDSPQFQALDEKNRSLGLRAITAEERVKLTKVITTLILLQDNPELVKPDILTKDLKKLLPANLADLGAKARKRGKVGWTIGEDVSKMPHVRSAHLARFWVGKGRKRLSIQLRSGCEVNYREVFKIPTGHAAEES